MKLIVRQVGLYLNLTGLKPFRSPAEVDISKINLNLLRTELHAYGVLNYEITEESKKLIKKKGKVKIEKEEGVGEKLDKIYNLLKNLTQENFKELKLSEQTLGELVKEVEKGEPVVETFIPTIDISHLESKSPSFKTEEGISVNESVEKLKSLRRKR